MIVLPNVDLFFLGTTHVTNDTLLSTVISYH